MGLQWWNPIKATEREAKNIGNLFSGDWAKINPFGLANPPGDKASRAADAAKAGQTVSTAADPLDARRRRTEGAATKELLG